MKKILFTGGTSGIAYHTIARLVSKEYFIYVTTHTDMECERMKKRFSTFFNVSCFRLDLLKEEDIEKVRALDIDILVCNAAIGEGGSLIQIPVSKIQHNFEVNVFQNIKLIQTFLDHMIEKDQGKIIVMASLAGIMPIPFLGSYAATKASLISMCDTLYYELLWISKNITITVIEPGFYHTGFNQVMLFNKYDWMKKNSPFEKKLFYMAQIEEKICRILEKERYDSIVNKIEEAIITSKPKRIYRAPFSHVLIAKLYQIFFR